MSEVPAEMLRQIPLFRDLDAQDFEAVVRIAQLRTYRPRQIVVRHGDPGGDLFVIVSGYLKVSTMGADGREAALGIMESGEVFGEIALIDGEPRSATVTALPVCELAVIERPAFMKVLEVSPKMAMTLLTVLARRLRRLSERTEDIVCLDVGARLAKHVVQLIQKCSTRTPSGKFRLDLKLSQQDMGDLVGATRESVNKHLRLWVEEGFVKQEAGHLIVCDLKAMEVLAEVDA